MRDTLSDAVLISIRQSNSCGGSDYVRQPNALHGHRNHHRCTLDATLTSLQEVFQERIHSHAHIRVARSLECQHQARYF